MDKRKLVANTAKKTDYAKWEIESLIDPIMTTILESLQKGEKVTISGFGKFELKIRKARIIPHPKTKEPMEIPEKVSVVFTVTKKFKPDDDTLSKLSSRDEK